MSKPFWRTRSLEQMSHDQWESLCDGCALCCLHKLEEEDSGDIYYTRVACRLLDLKTCRCSDYQNRLGLVSDCLVLTPQNTRELHWLPGSCAYRLLAQGEPLPPWHPLVSKNVSSARKIAVSACHFAISERDADLDDMEQYIID